MLTVQSGRKPAKAGQHTGETQAKASGGSGCGSDRGLDLRYSEVHGPVGEAEITSKSLARAFAIGIAVRIIATAIAFSAAVHPRTCLLPVFSISVMSCDLGLAAPLGDHTVGGP